MYPTAVVIVQIKVLYLVSFNELIKYMVVSKITPGVLPGDLFQKKLCRVRAPCHVI